MQKKLKLKRAVSLAFKFNLKKSLTALFLIASLFQLQANEAYGQKTKVSINLQNVSIEKVLNKIESLTEFKFLYNYSDIDGKRIVSVKADKKLVSSVLDDLFSTSNITYEMLGKQIVLKEKTVFKKQNNKVVQQIVIKGLVTDATGEPLLGVSVLQKGTRNGVSTDFDGNYTIKLLKDKEKTLVFSYLGFVTKTIKIKDADTTINVKLKEDAQGLDEVVIVGFGTQKKESMVSAITTINPKEIRGPNSNLTTMMAGRVSGMISYQRSGEPGEDNSDFFIRGLGSFGTGKQNPLILIDGIESTTTDMARLQPDDIDAFSVLKDASAAAVYGARGANGVVLITTKSGKDGKLNVRFRAVNKISSNTRNFQFADNITFMNLANEGVLTRNALRDTKNSLPYSRIQIERTAAGDNPYLYPSNNWIDQLIKDFTSNQGYNLSLSGGGEKAQYYLASTYNVDNGVLEVDGLNNFNSNIKLRNYSFRSNVNLNLTPSTEVIVRLYAQFDDYNGPIGGGGEIFNKVIWSNPVAFPATYPKEYLPYVNHTLFGSAESGLGSSILLTNPYAEMVKGYQVRKSSTINTQVELKQNLDFIIPGLSANLMGYIQRYATFDLARSYSPFYYSSRLNPFTNEIDLTVINDGEQGSIGAPGQEYLDYNEGNKRVNARTHFQGMLNYNTTIKEKHELSGMLIGIMQNFEQANPGDIQSSLPSRNLGISGRFIYNYDKRFLTEFNFGYNGSERFAKNNRFGFFPSVALGYNVSNESFFEPLEDVVTSFKLRASYGLLGNDQIGRDQDRFFYLSNVNLNDGNYGATFGENFFGYSRNGVSISRYSNPQITWEQSEQINFGFDLNLFNSIDVVFDIFRQTRSNILEPRANIGSTLGLMVTPTTNFGKAQSEGIDISLAYNKNFGDGWFANLRGNFTYSRSKVLAKDENNFPDELKYLYQKGQPINQRFGYIAERLFVDETEVANSPKQFGEYGGGDIKYRDINGDGVITELDKVPIGLPVVPEIIYGFGGTVGYKNFDFSVFFQGSARSSFYINPTYISPFVLGGLNGQKQFVPGNSGGLQSGLLKVIADDHWSEDNRDSYAFFPRLSDGIVENNVQTSTWWMRKGDFLRVKSVELGYNLPEKHLNKMNIKTLRVYANTTNPFVFSSFKLWDPEMGGNGLGYPIQTTFNFGFLINL